MDHTDPVWAAGHLDGVKAGRQQAFDLLAEIADHAGEAIGPNLAGKERDILKGVRLGLLQCGGLIRSGAVAVPSDNQEKMLSAAMGRDQ